MTVPFADRTDAGRMLVPELRHLCASRAITAPIVLGIPRGGVVVAAPVADALNAPLGVIVVRKVGSPERPEYALGALADGVRVMPAQAHLSPREAQRIARVERREREELARRTRAYVGGARPTPGDDVIVVDDGIATGSTATAAVRALSPAVGRVILAVPVAPAEWEPPPEVEAYVCLRPVEHFGAVGAHYDDFAPTHDAEVIDLLARARGSA